MFFLGWVDTRLYAQVIDIFIDSFPFPCTVTALQAMAAGKRIVSYDSIESRDTGVAAFIEPVLSGIVGGQEIRNRMADILAPDGRPSNWLFARGSSEYLSMAETLITCPERRRDVGNACRSFVDAFMSDSADCGQTYERHLVEIIERKAGLAAVA